MSNTNAQFQEILESAKARRGDTNTDTMIVASHLAQMRTFILRRGIEFYCEQDSYGKRRDFLKSIYDENMLEMKLDSIIDHFLCDGQGLFTSAHLVKAINCFISLEIGIAATVTRTARSVILY